MSLIVIGCVAEYSVDNNCSFKSMIYTVSTSLLLLITWCMFYERNQPKIPTKNTNQIKVILQSSYDNKTLYTIDSLKIPSP